MRQTEKGKKLHQFYGSYCFCLPGNVDSRVPVNDDSLVLHGGGDEVTCDLQVLVILVHYEVFLNLDRSLNTKLIVRWNENSLPRM